MPGPGWYLMDEAEEVEVLEALHERHLSRYRFDDPDAVSKTMQFERELGQILGSRHTLAVNSCTSALYAGLKAVGVGPGTEVLVPGYTFIASIAVIAYCGATPVLVDVDHSLTMDPQDAAAKISPRTRALVPVHMLGAAADLEAICALADGAGCAVVEDAAQACGGSYRGRRLGTVGAAGAFSLNTGKTITAGDGGVLCTDSDDLYEKAFAVHDHGFAPDRAGVLDGGARFGLNFRLHELAAAVGLAQVRKLDAILAKCRALAAVVEEELGELPGISTRTSHDAAGDCRTSHVLVFEDAERARAVAASLGGLPLGASPKHNYALMAQLQGDAPDPSLGVVRHGRPGQLSATDDILGRSVALSIGVVDRYLGTLGDITVLDDTASAAAKARGVRDLIRSTGSRPRS